MINKVTDHLLYIGDARDLSMLADESVHLVLTSPPYWNLKKYNEADGQLGHINDYEAFLGEIRKVWREVFRVLVPGGRLICVVGDVCLSRRRNGRHVVVPLHADICVDCRRIGFDNLNPIIWHKIANARFEVENGTKFLGKPYEPNAIIKNDIEFILMQRKPGGYRTPSPEQRELSRLSKEEYDRLVRMFSFVGDTVLDPFCGMGTTLLAAMRAGRNSIGVEIDADYARKAELVLNAEGSNLLSAARVRTVNVTERDVGTGKYAACT